MLAYNKENFALEATLPTYNEHGYPTEINICRLQIYGQGRSSEHRYLLGNAFLRSYYVMFNFENNTIGMNGEYYNITYEGRAKRLAPYIDPLFVALVAIGSLALIFLLICACIKR
jgi:hypothetical protein